MKNLNKLEFFGNSIEDLNFLNKFNCPNLAYLDLSLNSIKDISSFPKLNISNIIMIYLRNNEIEDISCLENLPFQKLKYLEIGKINIIKNDNDEKIINNFEKKCKI